MGIRVGWDDANQDTILVTYETGWSWDDYANAKVEIDTLLNSVSYTVDIISDSRQSGGMPRGNALKVIARSFQTAPANIGLVAVVGANVLFKSLLQLLQTISLNRAAGNMRFANNLEEAREILVRVKRARMPLSKAG